MTAFSLRDLKGGTLSKKAKSEWLKNNDYGISLIEVLVSLSIFLTIIIPLISLFYKQINSIEDSNRYTALCLMEQHTRFVRVQPDHVMPSKKVIINKQQWTIETSIHGTNLKTVKLAVKKNKRILCSSEFYIYTRQSR